MLTQAPVSYTHLEDLRRTLADLRDKHMVLIDTVGMSQRDRMVAEQAAMLMRSGEVNRLLLLNAGCRGDTLDDVVRAYSGEDLAGCIITKVDEATALAPALDCIVRHGLTLSYVCLLYTSWGYQSNPITGGSHVESYHIGRERGGRSRL